MNLWQGKSYHWHALAGAAVSALAHFGHAAPARALARVVLMFNNQRHTKRLTEGL